MRSCARAQNWRGFPFARAASVHDELWSCWQGGDAAVGMRGSVTAGGHKERAAVISARIQTPLTVATVRPWEEKAS